MLRSVTVTNPAGESLDMILGAPETSGLLISEITGLGPAKAKINTTELATSDGAVFNSTRLDTRNIVLSLIMMPFPDVETNRQKTYHYFPIKQQVKLSFHTDNRTCFCYGYVESNEPNIFSSQESLQISILCPDPYFYSDGDTFTTVFSGLDPLFEFPFSNESTTKKLIQMGLARQNNTASISYDGEVPAGIIITIRALGMVKDITIYGPQEDELMTIDTTKIPNGFNSGDEIIISTYKGNKYIMLLRAGQYTNIINTLNKGATWFQLYAGSNTFAYEAVAGVNNMEFKMEYRLVYEGV